MKKIFLKNTRISGFARKTTLGIVLTAMGMTFHACNNEDEKPVPTPSVETMSAKWTMPNGSQWESFEFFESQTYIATKRSGASAAMPRTAMPMAASDAVIVYGKYTINGGDITLDGLGTLKVENMTSDKAEFSFTPTDEAAAKYSVTVEVKITVTKTDPSPAPSLDYVIGDSATWVCQEQEVRSQQDTSSRWVCSDTSYYRQQMVWRDTTIFLRNEYRVSVDTNHFTLSYGYGYVYDSIMRGEWNPTYPELLEYYNSHGGHCEWLYDYASDFRCTSPSVVGGFVDTMPVVYGNIRRDTSMVRIDSTISYESMENVRVDTQYCRQQVERLTDTAINNITTTLRFTQSAAILSVQHSNPYSYNQYNGQYAYPYDGKAGRMSVKFDAQEWHYQGSVTATSMLLQNNGAGKVQRFVRR